MAEWAVELERRTQPRRRETQRCRVLVAHEAHMASVVNASDDGLFLHSDAPLWTGALVRVRLGDDERYAMVVHTRAVARSLTPHAAPGAGLRWLGPERA